MRVSRFVKFTACAAAASLIELGGSTAIADTTVEAELLFREGRALVRANKLAAACAAFESSERLEPAITTLLNLADCRERNLQLATAWSVYLQAASKARNDSTASRLAAVARDRAAALDSRLSFLTINVSDGSRVDGLTILRNGVALDPAVWNRAIPVDGGQYVITGKAPGLEPWSRTLEIQAERDHQSVNVPRFLVAAVVVARPTAAPAPPLLPPLGVATELRTPAPASQGNVNRTLLALGLAGGAVATLGLAAGFDLSSRASIDRYQRTSDASAALYDEANTKYHVAQGLMVVGISCAAAAMYLWRTAPSARLDRAVWAPVAAPGVAGAAVLGAF